MVAVTEGVHKQEEELHTNSTVIGQMPIKRVQRYEGCCYIEKETPEELNRIFLRFHPNHSHCKIFRVTNFQSQNLYCNQSDCLKSYDFLLHENDNVIERTKRNQNLNISLKKGGKRNKTTEIVKKNSDQIIIFISHQTYKS